MFNLVTQENVRDNDYEKDKPSKMTLIEMMTDTFNKKGFTVLEFKDLGNEGTDLSLKVKKNNTIFTYSIELKQRNNYGIHSFDNRGGFMMENKKYNDLMTKHKENGAIPLYANFTNDGYLIVWNLLKVPLFGGKNIYANRETMGSSDYSKEIVKKPSYLLDTKDGAVYRIKDNKKMGYGEY